MKPTYERTADNPRPALAGWQQSPAARFYQALNSGAETFAGIKYTAI